MNAMRVENIPLSHIKDVETSKEENYMRVSKTIEEMINKFKPSYESVSLIIYIEPYLAKMSNLNIEEDAKFMGMPIELGLSSPINYILLREI